jgi:hypothetical protein
MAVKTGSGNLQNRNSRNPSALTPAMDLYDSKSVGAVIARVALGPRSGNWKRVTNSDSFYGMNHALRQGVRYSPDAKSARIVVG